MRTLFSLGLLLALAGAAHGCKFYSWSVTEVARPDNALNSSYTLDEVRESLGGYGSWTNRYLDPVSTTFSCVDSRGSRTQHLANPSLETPGGDMSEFAALVVAYHRIKGTAATEDSVRTIFNKFMRDVATYRRPFYFHTADDKVQKVLQHFTDLTGEHASVIPMREPADERVRDAWYEALSANDAQGCGHVRLVMTEPAQFGLNTAAEANVTGWAIKSFFRYWWATADGSSQRRKVFHPILQGGLNGHSLTIVNNMGPGCEGLEPDLAPFHGGSTMFLYQPNAVAALRTRVLIPFIVSHDPSINGTAVMEELNALQGVQLAAVLRLLAPVNQIPIYQAELTSTYI